MRPAARGRTTVAVAALVVIAPLCLAIRQVTGALESLGVTTSVAGQLADALLGVLLALSLAGIICGYREHRRRWPVLLAVLSCAAILLFDLTRSSTIDGYLSCGGLIAAGVGNFILRRRGSPE